jgi:hypothetical protein
MSPSFAYTKAIKSVPRLTSNSTKQGDWSTKPAFLPLLQNIQPFTASQMVITQDV